MFNFLKKAALGVLILMFGLALTGCGNENAAKEQFLHIATGNTSGTYYQVGGAISEILNSNVKNMHSSVQSTSGSIANINFLADGTVELATIQNDIAHYAVNGTEMFANENKHKYESLRGIASLYPETCQFVTLESSGISSIESLRGKKVAVGVEGSGAEANARQILENYGITYNDIDAQFLSFSAGSKALREGKVDAAFLTAGFPTSAVQDVAAQEKIRVLPIADDHFTSLSEKYPFYQRIVIPKGTYGLEADVPTVSVMALLVCNESVNADEGYQITKTIFDNLEELKTAHSAISNLKISDAAEGMTLKINDGAEKFYKEQ